MFLVLAVLQILLLTACLAIYFGGKKKWLEGGSGQEVCELTEDNKSWKHLMNT